MNTPMIETVALTRDFGPVRAVDALDLRIEGAGVVGFLGPNGAGKTTTLRMLCGALPMSSGTARVAGFDVFDAPVEVKARVGYLPEQPPLYPELSVGEYLSFVAELRGMVRATRLGRVGEVMERVGLAGWERRLLGSLSKGYRQRVGLAQALLHDPRVLILDEPTSGLDPAQLVPIRALIRELASDRTVLLSTHVLSEVEQLCERVVLISRGRVVGDGTVDALGEQVGAGPWLELRLSQPGPNTLAQLGAIEVISEVLPLSAGRYRLRGGPGMVEAVASKVLAQGWGLAGLSEHPASLSEVFVALVEGAR